jgi:putative ABC transport system permease protein
MNQSIFILSWSFLKRRKTQSLLVGLCIALSGLLFASTLTLLREMSQPFDRMYEQLQASHLLLQYDSREVNSERIGKWFSTQVEVASVSRPVPFVFLESPLIFEDAELDLSVQLTERLIQENGQDQVFFQRGEARLYPGMGEIWIPDHLARSHHIEIGDSLGVPTAEGLVPLVVSATLVDPQYASGLFNPTRAWVAPGSLSFLFPIHQLTELSLGVRFHDPQDIATVWGRFHEQYHFQGNSLDYHLFKSVFLSFYQVISLVLLVFSLLALLTSLFILHSSLAGAIAADLRLIGIFKAIGYTPPNVRLIYLMQYLLLAILSLPVGLGLSYAASRVILQSLVQSLGLVNQVISFAAPAMITLCLFLVLVGIMTLWGSRKGAKIKAVAAFRSNPTTGSRAVPIFRRSWQRDSLGIPFLWGLSMLRSSPPRTIYTALSIVLASFILLFALNVGHSFGSLKDNKAAWGLEDSDLQVRRNEAIALPLDHASLLGLLQADSAIQVVMPFHYATATLPAREGQAPQDLLGKIYGGDLAAIGLENLQGKHPVAGHEISLCVLTAAEQQKELGDSMHLFIEGQHRIFAITGIYQDVSNLGQGFRLSQAAMKALNPLFEPEFYALKLRAGISTVDFEEDLQARLGETVVLEQSAEERKGIRATLGSMQGSLALVSVFFLAILFAVLFNDTLMNLRDYRHSLGILKTLGLTSVQLRRAQVYKFLLLTLGCLAVAVPLSLWLSPPLISSLTGSMGLESFPFLVNRGGTILVIPGMMACTGLSAWWASRRMSRRRPRGLLG